MSTLTLTLIQADLAWHDAAANRQAFDKVLSSLDGPGDLIVLPEMFPTGFTMDAEAQAEPMGGPTVTWMQASARATGAAICGSVIIEEDGAFRNRFLFVTPDGELRHYDKRHLFGLAGEDEHYQAGNDRIVFTYRGFRICPQICYDLRFPVWSRSRGDYDLLIYVANWPSRRHLAWQTLIRARAIENQAFVAAVNRCGTDGNDLPYLGGSAVLDFLGEDVVDLGDQAGHATVTIDLDDCRAFRDRFPFQRDADEFHLDGEAPGDSR